MKTLLGWLGIILLVAVYKLGTALGVGAGITFLAIMAVMAIWGLGGILLRKVLGRPGR
jgi:hypothetical protein